MLTTIIIIIVLFFIFVITYLVSNYLLTRSTQISASMTFDEPSQLSLQSCIWGFFDCLLAVSHVAHLYKRHFGLRSLVTLSRGGKYGYCHMLNDSVLFVVKLKKKHCSWCFQQSTSRQNICIYITFLTLNHSKSPCQFLGQPWSQHLVVKIRIYFIYLLFI